MIRRALWAAMLTCQACAAMAAPARRTAPLPAVTPVDTAARVLSETPADHPAAALTRRTEVRVALLARVDTMGVVRDVRVRPPAPAGFDASAARAARWWRFAPARRGGAVTEAWTPIVVVFPPASDPVPLQPDPIALALAAEKRRDRQGMLDAWIGAFARIGKHPTLRDEWSLRERVIRVARSMTPMPVVPERERLRAAGGKQLLDRTLARSTHEELLPTFGDVLRVVPWFAAAYRWQAAAELGAGRPDAAFRSLRMLEIAGDSADVALARRALSTLSRRDTLGAMQMLKY